MRFSGTHHYHVYHVQLDIVLFASVLSLKLIQSLKCQRKKWSEVESIERTNLTRLIFIAHLLQFALIAIGQHDHMLKSHTIHRALFKCKSPETLFIG